MANDYQPPRTGGTAKKTFTGTYTDQDLRAQSGYPTHAPAFLEVSGNAAGGDLIATDLRGNIQTQHIPLETVMTVEGPFATLDGDTADDLDVTAVWYIDSVTRFNP